MRLEALLLCGALGAITTDACAIPSRRQAGTDYIVTAAPVYRQLAALRGAERFPEGAELLRVHEGNTKPLVAGFAATADADVSFDGGFVLFAGKKSMREPWQIWELKLADGSLRRVTTTASDAERPLYLPGGRVLWAQRMGRKFEIESAADGRSPDGHYLNPTAGPGILPLTYSPGSAFPDAILADGRILFESDFPLGRGTTPELYTIYADGSGLEAYRCDHGRARWGGTQLAEGDVVFTHGASLGRFTAALAHEVPVGAPRAEYAGGPVETGSGAWLLSARAAGGRRFALQMLEPQAGGPNWAAKLEPVLNISGRDLVEPVLLAARERPIRYPSGLHPWSYAILLALDARISRDGALRGAPAAVRVETQGADGRLEVTGTAAVAQDGSFFVKAPGNRAIRFVLLDRKGAVLRQERGWFWARGGEQRICVGCHAGPARSPDNRVPEVLLHTTTPADLTGQTTLTTAGMGGQGR